jgi:hypothetical protein
VWAIVYPVWPSAAETYPKRRQPGVAYK